jgi:hypothetical protein
LTIFYIVLALVAHTLIRIKVGKPRIVLVAIRAFRYSGSPMFIRRRVVCGAVLAFASTLAVGPRAMTQRSDSAPSITPPKAAPSMPRTNSPGPGTFHRSVRRTACSTGTSRRPKDHPPRCAFQRDHRTAELDGVAQSGACSASRGTGVDQTSLQWWRSAATTAPALLCLTVACPTTSVQSSASEPGTPPRSRPDQAS